MGVGNRSLDGWLIQRELTEVVIVSVTGSDNAGVSAGCSSRLLLQQG